jgi:predicted XRE-type DNA-binding protein
MKKEIFKTIPGFEDYEISKNGEIISLKYGKWKYLNPGINKDGYREVRLYKDGYGYLKRIGYIILSAFVSSCPRGKEMSHLNGNKLDDRLENLKWETHEKNIQRRIEHGTANKGEKNGRAKLTNNQVIQIKKMIAQRYIQGYIAGMFNISRPIISHIKNNKIWDHI